MVFGSKCPRTLRILAVLALFLQGALINTAVEIDVPFYVSYLEARGIPSVVVGVYGMAPGLGVLLACFLNLPDRLSQTRGLGLVLTQHIHMVLLILSSLVQGVTAYLGPEHAYHTQLPILLTARVLLGALLCWSLKTLLDLCRLFFPDKYELVSGVGFGGCYIGAAYAAKLGALLFGRCGFAVPFLALGLLNFSFFLFNVAVFQAIEYYNNGLKKIAEGIPVTLILDEIIVPPALPDYPDCPRTSSFSLPSLGLAPPTILPLVVNFILMGIMGACNSNLVVYLQREEGLEESKGSTYLLLGNLVKMVAATGSGAVIRHRLLSMPRVMLVSSVCTGIGSLLLFPHPYLTSLLRCNAGVTAYAGSVLAGTGQAAGDIAAVFAVERLNERTARARSLAISLAVLSGDVGVFAGHMLGSVVRRGMQFHVGGMVLCGLAGFAFFLSGLLEVVMKRNRTLKVHPISEMATKTTVGVQIQSE